MRKLNRLLALSSTALLCGFAGSLGASAQDAPAPEQAPAPEAAPPPEQAPQASESSLSEASQKNLADFSSCIADKKSADLLFVLDQSQSLIGYEGEPATDGSHFRVDATKDIVNQLANLGKDAGADINVKLAGFGSGYYSEAGEYGGWTNVSGNAGALDKEIDAFRNKERTSDLETDYGLAYSGALKEFGDHDGSDCRAIVFFTDGAYVGVETGKDNAAARNILCTPDSTVSAFRQSNIRLFNVGLVPERDAKEQTELLTDLAEGEGCGQGEPNGAFFNGGEDPAALFAAFRNLIPTSGGLNKEGTFTEQFDFFLDNSVDPVRLSAVPKTSVEEGKIIPTLTGPDGQTVELKPDTKKVASADVEITTNDRLPGMVDVAMKKGGEGWAGKWTFGYKLEGGAEGEYQASMVMIPGLNLNLQRENGEKLSGGINSDQVIKAQLVDGGGQPRKLEGQGMLRAEFVPEEGESVTLLENAPIVDGNAVDIPLDKVENVAAGKLVTSVDITTKGVDNQPGSKLNPIKSETPLTITPVNMPSVGSAQVVSMTEKEVTIDVPVAGPGKVWLAEQSFGADEVTLPKGVDALKVTSQYDSADNALELAKGEEATLPVTLSAENMEDGALALQPELSLQSAEDNQEAQLPLQLKGSMTTPLSKSAFGLAFVLAVLLGLLIPLAVLYFMKWFSGRIPESPRMFAKTIPVKKEGTSLIRTDTGKPFAVSKDEFQGAVPVDAAPRRANLGLYEAKVKMGLSPFTAAHVEVEKDGSISGKGKQSGGRAILPLAVQNNWFFVGNANDKDRGEIVLTIDTMAHAEKYGELSEEINRSAPVLFEQVQFPAPKEPKAPKGPKGERGAQGAQAPQNAPGANAPVQHFPGQPGQQGGFGQPGQQGGFGQPGQAPRQNPQQGGFGQPGGFGQLGGQGGFGQPGQRGGFGQPGNQGGQPGGFGQPGNQGGFGQPGNGPSGNNGGWPQGHSFGNN